MLIRFAICALFAAGVAGCSQSVTVKDEEGNQATITEGSGGKMTVESETDDGKATYEAEKGRATIPDEEGNVIEFGGEVTEEALGLPFYPGSKGTGENTWTATGPVSVRTTPDPISKVVEFYRDKIGTVDTEYEMEGMLAMFAADGNRKILLMLSPEDGRTKITLSVSEGE